MDKGKELIVRPVNGVVVPRESPIPRPSDVTCFQCKFPMSKETINYISSGYDWVRMKAVIRPCPTCSGYKAQRMRARRDAESLARIFGGAAIPWRARDWEFANYPADADQNAKFQAEAFVRRHLAGDQTSKRFLFLCGPTGRCKTSLAICVLKEALKAGKSGLYVIVAELMIKLQATFNRDSDISQDELLNAVNRVDWLVLDELALESQQKTSSYVLRMLYLIIQKRADMGLYTVITSNLSPRDLERSWRPTGLQEGQFHEGLRISERLREYCEGVSVAGRNQRG